MSFNNLDPSKTHFFLSVVDYENIPIGKVPQQQPIRQIDIATIVEYSGYISNLIRAFKEEKLLKLTERNYDVFEKGIETNYQFLLKKKEENVAGIGKENHTEAYYDVNRLLLNLLSSIKTYLDHTETRLKRNFGHDSEQYLAFKKAAAEAYDSSFEYRFMSQIRNYAQHCGLPIGRIGIGGEDTPYPGFQLSFDRDTLLEDFDWKKIVKEDLEKQGEHIDVLPVIRKKVELILGLHNSYAKLEQQAFVGDAQQLLSLVREVKGKVGNKRVVPCLMAFIIPGINGGIDSRQQDFPIDLIADLTGENLDQFMKK